MPHPPRRHHEQQEEEEDDDDEYNQHHQHRRRPNSSSGRIGSRSSVSDSAINADVAYSKPTISYMQKRNLFQRDSILARHAYQTALPRWM